ncbi:MAG TPA: translation initiation factor IF-1 [Thermomicrobiales bacterium]|jgi:translation initiation factor IF-1
MVELSQRGVIIEAHPNAMFTVRLGDGRLVTVPLSGKLRALHVRPHAGDTVMVELSRFDRSRGRIVRRDPAPR